MPGVIYPTGTDTKFYPIGELSGYGSNIFRQAIHIPKQVGSYEDFTNDINESEETFIQIFKDLTDDINLFE